MKLYFRKLGGGPPLIILHGLYGSSDNWMSIAKKLSKRFEVFLPDLRNHGRSPHSIYHNYELMQNDIYEFCNEHKINKTVIIGHSMGGKVAMNFAKEHPCKVSHLIVVDISPKQYILEDEDLSHFFNHRKIMSALESINLSKLKHREDADVVLSKCIELPYIRNFLLKNLYHNSNKSFSWRINLSVLTKSLASIMAGFEDDISISGFPVLFIKGGLSDYILAKDYPFIEKIFPAAKVITIDNASHWLHAEYPQEFIKIINEFV